MRQLIDGKVHINGIPEDEFNRRLNNVNKGINNTPYESFTVSVDYSKIMKRCVFSNFKIGLIPLMLDIFKKNKVNCSQQLLGLGLLTTQIILGDKVLSNLPTSSAQSVYNSIDKVFSTFVKNNEIGTYNLVRAGGNSKVVSWKFMKDITVVHRYIRKEMDELKNFVLNNSEAITEFTKEISKLSVFIGEGEHLAARDIIDKTCLKIFSRLDDFPSKSKLISYRRKIGVLLLFLQLMLQYFSPKSERLIKDMNYAEFVFERRHLVIENVDQNENKTAKKEVPNKSLVITEEDKFIKGYIEMRTVTTDGSKSLRVNKRYVLAVVAVLNMLRLPVTYSTVIIGMYALSYRMIDNKECRIYGIDIPPGRLYNKVRDIFKEACSKGYIERYKDTSGRRLDRGYNYMTTWRLNPVYVPEVEFNKVLELTKLNTSSVRNLTELVKTFISMGKSVRYEDRVVTEVISKIDDFFETWLKVPRTPNTYHYTQRFQVLLMYWLIMDYYSNFNVANTNYVAFNYSNIRYVKIFIPGLVMNKEVTQDEVREVGEPVVVLEHSTGTVRNKVGLMDRLKRGVKKFIIQRVRQW